jgi:hypothetical protein
MTGDTSHACDTWSTYQRRKIQIPPDLVVNSRASSVENDSILVFLCRHDAESHDLSQYNINHINRLNFYHEIRWNLLNPMECG